MGTERAPQRGSRAPARTSPRRPSPAPAASLGLVHLQAVAGNQAVLRVLHERRSTFDDFDGKQYRISGSPPRRLIQEVKRQSLPGGKFGYVATGEVVGFEASKPVVRAYARPLDLGDWYPRVAHVNGMQVSPQSGISSAGELEADINKSLQASDAQHGAALGQDAIDVLYTYSAERSNFVFDVFDCVKGKVSIIDTVTEQQTALMLDAVTSKRRISISAHSRGTIKTDNAVRAVYTTLYQQRLAQATSSAEVQDVSAAATVATRSSRRAKAASVSPETVASSAATVKAKDMASMAARAEMDAYIQLIYAGNAVQYPSSVLKAEFYVSWLDPVSLFVGTYTGWGAKVASWNKQMSMSSGGGSGGHGFVKNYANVVGESIAKDIRKRPR